MFVRLTSRKRGRAASLLVALYALCLLMPAAVLAASESPAAAHCLTEDNSHGLTAAKSQDHGSDHAHEKAHADGSSHRHSDSGGDDPDRPGKCCGLFCLSALAPAANFVAVQREPASHLTSLFVPSLSGLGADRIDRPPRSLLSL